MSFDYSDDGQGGCAWAFIAGLIISAAAVAALALYAATHRGGSQPSSGSSQAAAASAASGACAAARMPSGQLPPFVDFRDSQFRDEDWTDSLLGTSTLDVARYDVRSVAVSGPGGSGYRSTHLVYAGRGAIYVLHLQSAAVYDPAACGRVSSIDASYQLLNRGAARPLQVFSFAVRQGGAVYGASRTNVDAASWTPVTSAGLVEGDFTLVAGSGPAHPDFSAGPLEFGYVTADSCGLATGAQPCGPQETTAAVGAWHVRVHR